MPNARHRSAEILSLLYILSIVKKSKRRICCPVEGCAYSLSYPPQDWNNAWKLFRNHILRMHGMAAEELSWLVIEELIRDVEGKIGEQVFYTFQVDPDFERAMECPPCVDIVYCTVRAMDGLSIACEQDDDGPRKRIKMRVRRDREEQILDEELGVDG